MDKNELQLLAQKYLDGTATPEEKQLLDQWYDTIHTGWTETVDTERDETEADVKQRILDNLNQKLFSKAEPEKVIKPGSTIKRLSLWIGSAAAVLALTFFTWSWYNQNNTSKISLIDKQVVNVPLNKIMHLTLPDGSRVWLNAGSVFRYPAKFTGKTRVVELVEGRAFFDVRHQTQHPFIVKTQNLNITVLGTSFDVRSYKKEGTTRVTVVTGKVGITMPGKANRQAIMLLPKQQVVLTHSTNQLVKDVSHEARINEWCRNDFVSDQESLGNVFKTIEKEYNIKINVENRKLLNEQVSVKLNNLQPLDTIMLTLSFTKHFKYQMANDSTVIVK
jgi:transmembrane sensor